MTETQCCFHPAPLRDMNPILYSRWLFRVEGAESRLGPALAFITIIQPLISTNHNLHTGPSHNYKNIGDWFNQYCLPPLGGFTLKRKQDWSRRAVSRNLCFARSVRILGLLPPASLSVAGGANKHVWSKYCLMETVKKMWTVQTGCLLSKWGDKNRPPCKSEGTKTVRLGKVRKQNPPD